jgi:hypothetical protein
MSKLDDIFCSWASCGDRGLRRGCAGVDRKPSTPARLTARKQRNQLHNALANGRTIWRIAGQGMPPCTGAKVKSGALARPTDDSTVLQSACMNQKRRVAGDQVLTSRHLFMMVACQASANDRISKQMHSMPLNLNRYSRIIKAPLARRIASLAEPALGHLCLSVINPLAAFNNLRALLYCQRQTVKGIPKTFVCALTWPLSFSEDDCTSSLGWPLYVLMTPERDVSEVLCTKCRERPGMLRSHIHGATIKAGTAANFGDQPASCHDAICQAAERSRGCGTAQDLQSRPIRRPVSNECSPLLTLRAVVF